MDVFNRCTRVSCLWQRLVHDKAFYTAFKIKEVQLLKKHISRPVSHVFNQKNTFCVNGPYSVLPQRQFERSCKLPGSIYDISSFLNPKYSQITHVNFFWTSPYPALNSPPLFLCFLPCGNGKPALFCSHARFRRPAFRLRTEVASGKIVLSAVWKSAHRDYITISINCTALTQSTLPFQSHTL